MTHHKTPANNLAESAGISREDLVNHLHQEYERAATHIRMLESVNDKIVSIAVTLIVAGFGYGLRENIDVVFLFLPIGFIGVFLYTSLQYVNMFWMGGYARAVEEKVNALTGSRVIYWETLVATVRPRRNVSNVALIGLYLVLFVGITSQCFSRVFAHYGMGVGWAYAGFILFCSLCLLLSTREMLSAYERSYQASKAAYE